MRLLAALLPSHLLVRLASHLDHLAHHDANVTLCQLGGPARQKMVRARARGSATLLKKVSKLIDTPDLDAAISRI